MFLWARILLLVGGLGMLALGVGQWWSLARSVSPRVGRWLHGEQWPAARTDRRQRTARTLQAVAFGLVGLASTLYGASLFFGPPTAWFLFAVVLPLQWLGLICLVMGTRKARGR